MPKVLRDKDYSTEYTFGVSAVFSQYPNEITFTLGKPPVFKIRDYCVAMKIYDIPSITPLNKNFNLTWSGKNDPWTVKISKHLVSGQSNFIMGYTIYEVY